MAEPSRAKCVLLDTNLLLLLLVGTVGRAWVAKHKRTTQFSAADFDFLVETLQGSSIVTTPNVLAEVSNLGALGFDGPAKHRFFDVLKDFVLTKFDERQMTGKTTVESLLFQTLGLTDAGIERVASENVLVLTTDAPLWGQLQKRKLKAVNYAHLRRESLT